MKNLIWIPVSTILGLIIYLLWSFTIKDYLPTPLPKNYQPVQVGEKIKLPFIRKTDKPILLHFFNPLCPCSRFNLDYVKKLAKNYQKDFQFVMVLQIADKDYDFSDLKNTLGKHTQYIVDDTGEIAQQCGVYSTPQAVILNTKNQLYYRGNYNRARYCTDKKTNYAQMAMDSLLAQKPPPNFGLLATKAYGCELPQEQFEYENQ